MTSVATIVDVRMRTNDGKSEVAEYVDAPAPNETSGMLGAAAYASGTELPQYGPIVATGTVGARIAALLPAASVANVLCRQSGMSKAICEAIKEEEKISKSVNCTNAPDPKRRSSCTLHQRGGHLRVLQAAGQTEGAAEWSAARPVRERKKSTEQ